MPLDIEWAISRKEAAIFQFRPITTHILDYTIEWDNTNITESYPGITLPLTYTFIRQLYAKVYPEFLKLLGHSETSLAEKTGIFQNMLGYVQGRIYYNINNWYKLVSLLPGYKYNKEFFETMLMPAKKNQTLVYKQKKTSLNNKIQLSITSIRFLCLLLQTNRLSKKFTKKYISSYEKYVDVLWEQLTAIEILNTFNKIEKELLQQWAVPILNDFRTMIFHGILKKVFFPKDNDSDYIRLLSGIYDYTSIEPIHALNQLAKEVKNILKKYPQDEKIIIDRIMQDKKYEQLRKHITEYLIKYGSRTPDELKLENPRLYESFPDFVSFIIATAKGYTVNPYLKKKQKSMTPQKSFASYGTSPLTKFISQHFFQFILYQTKSGISNRERFRFYRAQVFGLARNAYLALGNRFVKTKLIKNRDDIFYLTREEIADVISGHSFDISFREKIIARKKLFIKYDKQTMARRILSTGLIAPITSTADTSVLLSARKKLTGLGVSKGTFKGEVIIVKDFNPHADVKGKILVTEHTDPGWTLLFLNASALVVERGNALSHASIVSRELGIPAVVAVDNVCNMLKNKDRVMVNGDTGEIIVL